MLRLAAAVVFRTAAAAAVAVLRAVPVVLSSSAAIDGSLFSGRVFFCSVHVWVDEEYKREVSVCLKSVLDGSSIHARQVLLEKSLQTDHPAKNRDIPGGDPLSRPGSGLAASAMTILCLYGLCVRMNEGRMKGCERGSCRHVARPDRQGIIIPKLQCLSFDARHADNHYTNPTQDPKACSQRDPLVLSWCVPVACVLHQNGTYLCQCACTRRAIRENAGMRRFAPGVGLLLWLPGTRPEALTGR